MKRQHYNKTYLKSLKTKTYPLIKFSLQNYIKHCNIQYVQQRLICDFAGPNRVFSEHSSKRLVFKNLKHNLSLCYILCTVNMLLLTYLIQKFKKFH